MPSRKCSLFLISNSKTYVAKDSTFDQLNMKKVILSQPVPELQTKKIKLQTFQFGQLN